MGINFNLIRRPGNLIFEIEDGIGAIETIRNNREHNLFLFDWIEEINKLVSRYRWYYKEGYCATADSSGRDFYLHWMIFGRPQNKLVLHHNQERRDNRRTSMRLIPPSLNVFARTIKPNKSTGIRGISKYRNNTYAALVGLNCRREFHRTLEPAIAARNRFEREILQRIENSPVPDFRLTDTNNFNSLYRSNNR